MKTGGGDWRDVSISLEHSAATSHLMGHLMLGEAGRTRPLSLQREPAQPAPGFQTPASRL